jgi:glutamate synthase domain-containing protein 2
VDYGSCEPAAAVAADLTTPRAFATGLRNEGQALIFVGGAGGGTGAADWFYGDNFKFATN